MKYKLLAINGEFFCRNLTGIERLAIEVTGFLDKMVAPNKVELIIPANVRNVPSYKNIKVVKLEKEAHFFPKWTQFVFQKYVLSHKALSLDFSNTCPFFCPGIEFIHDIYCKLFNEDFTSKRDRLISFYSRIMYHRIAKKAKKIVTVSEYTKKTILETYKIKPERIAVVYSGIGEYQKIEKDMSVFEKFPVLKENEFFFTLGSLSTRKNLKWIASHAQLFPQELFVICGKPIPAVVPPELEKLKTLKNVIMTGYLSDSQVKAMLSKCKAFVFPSYFEGFGLPPLEALSCGAPIIISNKTCLPEIYQDCAHYINPDVFDVDLNKILEQPIASPEKLLEKYTLQNTAKRLLSVINEVIKVV